MKSDKYIVDLNDIRLMNYNNMLECVGAICDKLEEFEERLKCLEANAQKDK